MPIILFIEGAQRFNHITLTALGGRGAYVCRTSIRKKRGSFGILTDMVKPSRGWLIARTSMILPTRAWLGALSSMDADVKSRGFLSVLTVLGEPRPIPEYGEGDAALYIDGISLDGQFDSVKITLNEDAIHNSVDIECVGEALFHRLRDGLEHRIEVTTGEETFRFLAESVSGNERGFRVWGRSLSALEDSPYAADVSYVAEGFVSAKSVCEGLLSVCSLSWVGKDCLLPPGFTIAGVPPVAAIKQIADSFGYIVRAGNGSEIIVRKKYPVRPVEMATATADIDYDDIGHIFELSVSREPGKGYSSVRVSGYGEQDIDFTMELEPGEKFMGDDVFIRVYWPKKDVSADIASFLTQGTIEYLGEAYGHETEEVTFTDGKASVRYPVVVFESATFYPAKPTNIRVDAWSTELFIDAEYALADVTYTTRYQRFRVSKHSIERLLVAMSTGNAGTDVIVYIPQETEIEAPAITDGNLTSVEALKERGTAFLDDTRYTSDRISLDVPYFAGVRDGQTAFINDAGVRIKGNVHISNVTINIGRVEITSSIEVIRWIL